MDGECCSTVDHTKVKFEENNSLVIIENTRKAMLEKCRVDNCLVKSGIRCDYLIRYPNKFTVYIELKGRDLKHAINQIDCTISNKDLKSKHEKLKLAIVSCSKVKIPKADSFILKAKQAMSNKHKARLVIRCSPISICPFSEFSL